MALVMVWLLGCLGLWLLLSAHPVIAGAIALFAVPAALDIVRGTTASLRIDHKEIRWHSGARSDAMARGVLKSVRLDTRLDFSVRLTLITHQGGKLRLPYECVPPKNTLSAALKAHDIPYQTHHFSLMG